MLVCNTCRKSKPLSGFHANQRTCKDCRHKYYKQRYAQRKLDILAINKAYRHTHKGRMAVAASIAKYRAANPQAHTAHIITSNAIRLGKLKKQPCEKCRDKKVEAHHDDYTKPLSIRWLCKLHHERQHHEQI